jgi:gas vesicle protein
MTKDMLIGIFIGGLLAIIAMIISLPFAPIVMVNP